MKRTKIIATIGPASSSPQVLKQLIKAGIDLVRLNLSHGAYQEHEAVIGAVRKINPGVAVLCDLQGPRVRTGKLSAGQPITLTAGEFVALTAKKLAGTKNLISLYPGSVIKDLKVGETILIADASIKLKVVAKSSSSVTGKIIDGGVLAEHKGVNLPQTRLALPSLTAKDKKDLAWAVKNQADYIALSFVRQAKDILAVKQILKRLKADIPVIAKLEKPEAIKDLASIVAVADAVMVARGDLGLELSLEKVPEIQKNVIALCQKASKPVIVATQMLESMVDHEQPTRAEVSDVANAIYDGTDAVMLSEETSIGQDPVKTVQTMVKIITEAEKELPYKPVEPGDRENLDLAVAHSATVLAHTLRAKALVSFTETGSTALRVAKQRPKIPIFGVVTKETTLRRLALYFGVQAVAIRSFKNIAEMISHAEAAIRKVAKFKNNELVVITAGVPTHQPGVTNLIKVHRLGRNRNL